MDPEKIGRYEVIRELGRGGMAVVFLSTDPLMKREVAIKLMPRMLHFDTQFRMRFEREAEIIASLEHPAIVPVYDFGYSDEQPFIVMRYMHGGSLAERLTKTGPISPKESIRIFRQLTPALDDAHNQGIIHRDLKPANILFDQRDNAYITDFGIAKLSEASVALTGSAIIGTPAYMSPEQALGKTALDGRSDVYSMGVVLFEMLTGKLPYEADTPMSLALAHINEPIPNILDTRPELNQLYKELIEGALAKERDERYGTLAEFLSELETAEKNARASITVKPAPPSQQTTEANLEAWYIKGLNAYWLDEWHEAREHLGKVIQVQPDYQDAAQKLEEVERKLQLLELYKRGVDSFDSGAWKQALEAFEELVVLDADFQDARTKLELSRKQVQLEDLYEEAHRLHRAGQWQAVINVFTQINRLNPDHRDPDGLLASAKRELAEAKHQHELGTLYNQALHAMNESRWNEAQSLLEKVREKDPGFQETVKLLDRVEAEIAREEAEKKRARIKALYDEGTTAQELEEWGKARDAFQKILKIEPSHADAQKKLQEILEGEQSHKRSAQLSTPVTSGTTVFRSLPISRTQLKWILPLAGLVAVTLIAVIALSQPSETPSQPASASQPTGTLVGDFQTVLIAQAFPKDAIEKSWSQGFDVTSLTYGEESWAVVLSKVPGGTQQIWHTNPDFPKSFIEKKWAEEFDVAGLAYGTGSWALVMSKTPGGARQIWHTNPDFPKNFIEEKWAEGFDLTNLAYGNNSWAVVMSQAPGGARQIWHIDPDFPDAFIEEKWAQDFDLTNLAYGNGSWAVVMSQAPRGARQIWHTDPGFPGVFIEEKWAQGFELTNLAYGNGMWAVVMAGEGR